MSPPEQPTLSEIKAEKEQHISWDTDCNLFQFTSALEAVCIVYDEIQQDTLSHATPFIRQDLDYPLAKMRIAFLYKRIVFQCFYCCFIYFTLSWIQSFILKPKSLYEFLQHV